MTGRRATVSAWHEPMIDVIVARAFTIPTGFDKPDGEPESDGTLTWDATTIVVVEAQAAGRTGLGYTYAHHGAASLISGKLAPTVVGRDALDVGGAWAAMWREVRNLGQSGLAAMAVSAVDTALWDLKARLLDVPLVVALDAVHDRVPVYGSGGFCNYSDQQLADQLDGWVGAGLTRVKIKTGREPERDEQRLRVARGVVGDDVALFVDANGAFTRAEAERWAQVYGRHGVTWFEEPVTSDDLPGLRAVRERAPVGLEVAAGEYAWSLPLVHALLAADAVDCLQLDVTRCGGISGFRRAAALSEARSLDVSAHCAPQLSAHACTSVWKLRHLEYFHDHRLVEDLLFDGCLEPIDGALVPDRTRPGHGLALKEAAAEEWRVS